MYTSNTLYRRRQITNNPLAAIPTGIIAGLGVCPSSGSSVGVAALLQRPVVLALAVLERADAPLEPQEAPLPSGETRRLG